MTLLCRLAGLVVRPSPPGRAALPDTDTPQILVIKPLALGDVLRTTPFLDALRRAYPRARIAFATGDYSEPALANNPHIDEILRMGNLGVPRRYDARTYLRFARQLRKQHFDVAFVLDRSPLMALLPYLARIPYRIGLHSHGRGFPHTTRVTIERDDYEVEAYLRVARAAGLNVQGVRCHFHPSPRDASAALRIVQEFGLDRNKPLIVMAPGGGVNPGAVDVTKRWPVERYGQVADALIDGFGAAVMLVGLPSDASSVAALRRAMRLDAVDLSGQTSFGQLAALIEQSDLFVGNDSAAAQLAACVGTPSVTIFTSTEPWIYGPYAPNTRWVFAGDPQHGLSGLPSVDEVIDAAGEALQTRQDSGESTTSSAPPEAGTADA